MKPVAARALPFAALLLLLAVPAAPALGQADEEGRFSLGIGAGMVQTAGESDPYLTGNLRCRIGYRVAGEERQGSVFGFLEPEVGYRTRDTTTATGRKLHTKDSMLGVNVGGAVRLRVFEYFVGGGVGYHFIDRDVLQAGQVRSVSDGNIGVNAHFGFDVRVSELVSIFGVGRFDLIQESDSSASTQSEEQQTKVYLGLRVHL
jgi:opacity protein-like surface antigen